MALGQPDGRGDGGWQVPKTPTERMPRCRVAREGYFSISRATVLNIAVILRAARQDFLFLCLRASGEHSTDGRSIRIQPFYIVLHCPFSSVSKGQCRTGSTLGPRRGEGRFRRVC